MRYSKRWFIASFTFPPPATSALDRKIIIMQNQTGNHMTVNEAFINIKISFIKCTILYRFCTNMTYSLSTDNCRVMSLSSATPLNALVSRYVHAARPVHSDHARVMSYWEAPFHYLACLGIKCVTLVWIYCHAMYEVWNIRTGRYKNNHVWMFTKLLNTLLFTNENSSKIQ